MKLPLIAATLAASLASANASVVLQGFIDMPSVGAPNLLTLHANGFEGGAGIPGPNGVGTALQGDPLNAHVYSLSALHWTNADSIVIGLTVRQDIGTGITLQNMQLDLYTATGSFVTSFGTNVPLDLGKNGTFLFVLDANDRAGLNSMAGLDGSWLVGLFATMGCSADAVGCHPSNDGAEEFVAIGSPSLTQTPLPGAAFLFGTIVAIAGGVRQLRRRASRAVA